MDAPHLTFHHFGLAVRRPEPARNFLLALGYRIGETIFDPGQNVRLAMCHHDHQPAVELISPGEGSGPIDTLVQRHTAGIVYHLCYETTNLAEALSALEKRGLLVVCVSPPKPAPLFAGQMVSFYNVVGLGLIEVLELSA